MSLARIYIIDNQNCVAVLCKVLAWWQPHLDILGNLRIEFVFGTKAGHEQRQARAQERCSFSSSSFVLHCYFQNELLSTSVTFSFLQDSPEQQTGCRVINFVQICHELAWHTLLCCLKGGRGGENQLPSWHQAIHCPTASVSSQVLDSGVSCVWTLSGCCYRYEKKKQEKKKEKVRAEIVSKLAAHTSAT